MPHPGEHAYLDLLARCLTAPPREDRTGTGTRSIWAPDPLRFDLTAGFPLLTSKRVFWRGVVEELLWFIAGHHDTRILSDKGVHIWDAWADTRGSVGPVYGVQWRSWGGWQPYHHTVNGGIDQLASLLTGLVTDPTSRRHVVSAWNVEELPHMRLPPCHLLFQCYVDASQGLHLRMTQRSADVFLGLPFNIASYALLTHIIAKLTHLTPASLTIDIGDAHLYRDHEVQARDQLLRRELIADLLTPRVDILTLPCMISGDSHLHTAARQSLAAVQARDIRLSDYEPLPPIPAPISV